MSKTEQEAAGSERSGAVAVPADRELRVPVQLPHRRPRRAGRRRRLALHPVVRLAERVREPPRPRRRRVPARAVRHQPSDGAGLRAGDERPRDHMEDPDRLDRRPRRAHDRALGPRGRDHAAHAASGRRRRRSHARPDGRMPGRDRRGRARLRAGLRLCACPGRVDAGRRRPAHGRRHRRRRHLPAAERHGARHRGRPCPGAACAHPGRAPVLLALVGRRPRLARRRRRGCAAPRRHGAFLALLAGPGPPARTIAGAIRSSARRSRSRA